MDMDQARLNWGRVGWLKRWSKRRNSQAAGGSSVAVDPTFTALARTRAALRGLFHSMTGGKGVGGRFWEELEETLVAADMGVEIATEVVEAVHREKPTDPTVAQQLLATEILARFDARDRTLAWSGAEASDLVVVMVVGVNGAGKTTTAAKITNQINDRGQRCLLGGADTFRPAAQRQLGVWAESMGVDMVGGREGADPAAVARDAWSAARSRGHQVLVVDTAGRLHSKTHLMEQLVKIKRVLATAAGKVDEVLLVLDASTGQNGLAQAREFCDRVGVTGVVLTKLDGTARGGVAVAVEGTLGTPIKLVGTGETLGDLAPFSPERFVQALLGEAPA